MTGSNIVVNGLMQIFRMMPPPRSSQIFPGPALKWDVPLRPQLKKTGLKMMISPGNMMALTVMTSASMQPPQMMGDSQGRS